MVANSNDSTQIETKESIKEQYVGMWHCIESDDFKYIMNLGAVIEIEIIEDGSFIIQGKVGNDSYLLNTGSWNISHANKKAVFQLPDYNNGLVIYGSFILKDDFLYYVLDDFPENIDVFKRY